MHVPIASWPQGKCVQRLIRCSHAVHGMQSLWRKGWSFLTQVEPPHHMSSVTWSSPPHVSKWLALLHSQLCAKREKNLKIKKLNTLFWDTMMLFLTLHTFSCVYIVMVQTNRATRWPNDYNNFTDNEFHYILSVCQLNYHGKLLSLSKGKERQNRKKKTNSTTVKEIIMNLSYYCISAHFADFQLSLHAIGRNHCRYMFMFCLWTVYNVYTTYAMYNYT